jgi:hypothetical protein
MSKTTNNRPNVRVATVNDHMSPEARRALLNRARFSYSSATENAAGMYDQTMPAIMGRFYRCLKIDRSGGDGR